MMNHYLTRAAEPSADAAVMIVLGQSNAHGHGLAMKAADRIDKPLKNVFGLNRMYNQHLGLSDVTWSGYTSSEMNLGETQDHTYCLSSELARLWQAEIDRGNPRQLPDLYIIQISIGAQGVVPAKGEQNNMWYPYRPEKLIPGPLGTVDISLFSYSVSILKLAMNHLRKIKKNPAIIGLHWSGANDCVLPMDQLEELAILYPVLFQGFRKAIGQDYILYLEKLLLKNRLKDLGLPEEGMHFENELYRKMVQSDSQVKMISAEASPFWEEDTLTNGIFVEDHVHYTADVQKWFAHYYLKQALLSFSKADAL
ncbi:MAG: hypothetical protein VB070_14055 [Clostridiaceae bacterium]|nr:hypothetical protein [Clostridiaceae bacterium]